MYLVQSLTENWNRSRVEMKIFFFETSSFQISGNVMLWVKVCRYVMWDANFYQDWDIIMHENCMCQCYIVSGRCTKTLHWDMKLFSGAAETTTRVSIKLSFFTKLLKILFSSSLREALAVRIWVKESGFTL